MGWKATGARCYFSAMPRLIRVRISVVISLRMATVAVRHGIGQCLAVFLYSMLMNDCRSALEVVGSTRNWDSCTAVRLWRAALALDLMEEFRAILADRLPLTLINRNQLKADDFVLRPGGPCSRMTPVKP